MPFFFLGWFLGSKACDGIEEINRSSGNGLWGLLLWILIPALGAWGARSNFGADAAYIGATLAFISLVAFVLWKPLASRFKVMMLSSVRFVLGLVILFTGGSLLLRCGYLILSGELKQQGLANVPLTELAASAAYLAGAFAVIFTIVAITERDRKRMTREAAEKNDPRLLPLEF